MRINELENGLSQAQGAHEMSSMDVQEALQRFLVVSDGSLPVQPPRQATFGHSSVMNILREGQCLQFSTWFPMIVYLILACCTRTPKHQKEEKEEKKREKGCNKLVTQNGLS